MLDIVVYVRIAASEGNFSGEWSVAATGVWRIVLRLNPPMAWRAELFNVSQWDLQPCCP